MLIKHERKHPQSVIAQVGVFAVIASFHQIKVFRKFYFFPFLIFLSGKIGKRYITKRKLQSYLRSIRNIKQLSRQMKCCLFIVNLFTKCINVFNQDNYKFIQKIRRRTYNIIIYAYNLKLCYFSIRCLMLLMLFGYFIIFSM